MLKPQACNHELCVRDINWQQHHEAEACVLEHKKTTCAALQALCLALPMPLSKPRRK